MLKGTSPSRYESPEVGLECARAALEELGYVMTFSTGPTLATRDHALRGRLSSPFTNTVAVVSVTAGRPVDKTWFELRVAASSSSSGPGAQNGILHNQGEQAVIANCGASRTGAVLERIAN